MNTASISSKGQITIPDEVRDELKIKAGDRIEFTKIAPGRYEIGVAEHNVYELKACSVSQPKRFRSTP